jgi:predicted glycosyl hydrolase (DUF1957 family)
MSFIYIGNATFLNPDHITRIRATKVEGQCEILTSASTVYVIPFDYLERSQASLTQIADKLRDYDAAMKKRVTDEERQTTPRQARTTEEILNSIVNTRKEGVNA